MKKYFKIIIRWENKKGDVEQEACWEGHSDFNDIKKLIDFYKNLEKLDIKQKRREARI